jgi:hypothetical protein
MNTVQKPLHSLRQTLFLGIAVVGLIAADHLSGPIFPDDWYCYVGAGKVETVQGTTEPSSWTMSNGCGAYRTECVKSWTHTPTYTLCNHATLWVSINKRLSSSIGGVTRDSRDEIALKRWMSLPTN